MTHVVPEVYSVDLYSLSRGSQRPMGVIFSNNTLYLTGVVILRLRVNMMVTVACFGLHNDLVKRYSHGLHRYNEQWWSMKQC